MAEFTFEEVRDEALKLAEERGWHVDPATCQVEGIPTATSDQIGVYDHWKVTMRLDPKMNPHRPLSRNQLLTARVRQVQANSGLDIYLVETPEAKKARLRDEDAI